ncbi:MAG: DUF302 domain-containing protein [Ignavibacteriales bacterium]|nr:DUF302 domain-containing protein [Ignavibacteriota bacterium]MCB9248186.1 DUF302 domain-containing protein [Ignavibacteriales bacterium]
MSYYFAKTVKTNFEDTLTKVEEELKKESFGVLTEIDVQATLKKKLDVDFRKYKILGACNPPFAHKALTAEDKIGVLLPCNVIVQELDDNKVEVAIVNPIDSMQSVKSEALAKIASEITEKLKRVLENI